jgi:mono/diheme cytochrome c family protein
VVCHRISGEGGTVGPDLTFVGRRRPEKEIHDFIEDPEAMMGEPSVMPAFGTGSSPSRSPRSRSIWRGENEIKN